MEKVKVLFKERLNRSGGEAIPENAIVELTNEQYETYLRIGLKIELIPAETGKVKDGK